MDTSALCDVDTHQPVVARVCMYPVTGRYGNYIAKPLSEKLSARRFH